MPLQAIPEQQSPPKGGPDRNRPQLDGEAAANAVFLRGRVTGAPYERELPSGVTIVTFRVSIRRARTAMTKGSRQQSDWVDCSAWTSALRRSTLRWQVGDTVEVEGSFRRRFRSNPGGASSMVEIEISSARRISEGSRTGAAQSQSAQSR